MRGSRVRKAAQSPLGVSLRISLRNQITLRCSLFRGDRAVSPAVTAIHPVVAQLIWPSGAASTLAIVVIPMSSGRMALITLKSAMPSTRAVIVRVALHPTAHSVNGQEDCSVVFIHPVSIALSQSISVVIEERG